jgi:hypothetical protein
MVFHLTFTHLENPLPMSIEKNDVKLGHRQDVKVYSLTGFFMQDVGFLHERIGW